LARFAKQSLAGRRYQAELGNERKMQLPVSIPFLDNGQVMKVMKSLKNF
jgi:hypothetical protein